MSNPIPFRPQRRGGMRQPPDSAGSRHSRVVADDGQRSDYGSQIVDLALLGGSQQQADPGCFLLASLKLVSFLVGRKNADSQLSRRELQRFGKLLPELMD